MANKDAHRSIYRIVGYMLLVATPFLSVGLFASWWSASLWAEYASMKQWVEAPAIIKTTELEEHSARKSTRYEVFATYDYEHAKQRYSGSRVTLLSGLMNQGTFNRDAYKELKDHRVQQAPFRCYVNPNSPQESILYRELPGFPLVQSTLLATVPGTIGMILLVVAVGTLVSGSQHSRHNTEQSQSNNGKLRLVAFWAIIGTYWSCASLPLDRKIAESIFNGGGLSAWLAIAFPLIGILILARAIFFLFESSPIDVRTYEPSASACEVF